jgi:hypothetical protein
MPAGGGEDCTLLASWVAVMQAFYICLEVDRYISVTQHKHIQVL